MNGILLPELDMVDAFFPLHPSQRHYDVNAPRLSTEITIPSQTSVVWGEFLGLFDATQSDIFDRVAK